MTMIKSILAAYSGDVAGSSGLELAILMARKYGAHLTGVVWHGPSLLETRYHRLMPQDVRDILQRQDAEAVAEIRSAFEERLAREPDIRSSFLEVTGRSDFSLAVCARGYDIVVMGSRAAEIGRSHLSARPDVVALRSARPLILVPQGYRTETLGESALVAWDGERSVARALADAMHILETKTRVTVLTVGEPPASCGPDDDVMRYLDRHGVRAERMIRPAGRDGVAGTILDARAETGASLLIMGAHEHSKFSENRIGGTTREILDRTPVPVLMAH